MSQGKGITITGSGEQDTLTLRIRVMPNESFDFEHDAQRLYDFLIENLPVGTLDILIDKLNKRSIE